jgi:hypothetical protein
MSFIMVRFSCEEMGIGLSKKSNDIEERPSPPLAVRFGVLPLRKAELKADHRYADLCDVLRAANRAVAHIDEVDVDHPFKTDGDDIRIFGVVDWIEGLVKPNIYRGRAEDFGHSMSLPNNVMYWPCHLSTA